MSRLALLCSGQGMQSAGMFAFALQSPVATAFLHDSLDRACGISNWRAMDEESLFDNRIAQPLIVACTLANWIALQDKLKPRCVAGYSVGEVAALAVSGSLSPVQAVALAVQRAGLMSEAAALCGPQAMLACSGIGWQQLAPVCRSHDAELAIRNGTHQYVIGGTAKAVQQLGEELQQRFGSMIRLTFLPVRVASHTSLMQPAAETFHTAITQYDWQPAACAVIAGTDASEQWQAARLQDKLCTALTQTLRWDLCMDTLAESGVRQVLELGPGNALSRMLRERHAQLDVRAVQDFRSLAGVAAWLEQGAAG